jgi:beta-N-acetylglucosaminidase
LKKIIIMLTMFIAFFAWHNTSNAGSLDKELEAMIKQGVMRGDGEGNYRPNDSVTRGEFATFMYRALELPDDISYPFDDVNHSSALAFGINSASAVGIVNGYTSTIFKPTETITREQMAAMIYRALEYKGVELGDTSFEFEDSNRISPSFQKAVQVNANMGIIKGYNMPNGTSFKPKELATRAQAAAFIYRMQQAVEADYNEPFYRIATMTEGVLNYKPTKYTSYDEAVQDFDENSKSILVYKGRIVKMNEGIVVASSKDTVDTKVYDESMEKLITSVSNELESEMKYLDSDDEKVKVLVDGVEGYVKQDNVTLFHGITTQRSHYLINNGYLYHKVYYPISKKYDSYIVGKAPAFMETGKRYYTWDGHTFYNNGKRIGESYAYFNRLSVRAATNYTAEEIEKYIEKKAPDSVLVGLGDEFKRAEEEHGVNALLMLSHAILESEKGTSPIAIEKKNLFGIGATGEDPYENAKTFDSYEESIEEYASIIIDNYVDYPDGPYSHGAIYGNKSVGFNVHYASDINWGKKVGGLFYETDIALGGKDLSNPYQIAETIGENLKEEGLNFRSEPQTGATIQYEVYKEHYPLTIVDEVENEKGLWYKVFSDSKEHKYAYVHSDYVEILPVAELQ